MIFAKKSCMKQEKTRITRITDENLITMGNYPPRWNNPNQEDDPDPDPNTNNSTNNNSRKTPH